MYCFEYDDKKSASNLKKHGIDFVMAQGLWNDPDLIEIQAISNDEPRFLIIASLANKIWSAVITYRGSTTIRIISVRRARKAEAAVYES
ncbi:MAG: BrnT family toxin [Gammaproteobacteria bacterium]|nr:BrnT family toxin [Gammaproteobacteria bacterium]